MEVVSNFFAVRPVFTLFGLRVLWGAYLIEEALPFVAVLSNPNLSTATIIPLLIEVAASLLLGRPNSHQ